MNNDAAIRVLRATKQNLLDYGWIQGELGDTEKGFCLLGALAYSAIPAPRGWIDALYAMKAALKIRDLPLSEWNDANGRTRYEVIAAIDAAVTLLEQETP